MPFSPRHSRRCAAAEDDTPDGVPRRGFCFRLRAPHRGAALSPLAAELIRLEVDVIITQGVPAALAAKQATATIPIVMAIVGNPVESGIVASLARPGGNVTGSSFFIDELNAKRLDPLKTLLPERASS